MQQLTAEQARWLAKSKWWKGKTAREIVTVQLYQDRLCTDWAVFHAAVEEVFGRPVWSHEFAYPDRLRAEFNGDCEAPSFSKIMDLLDPDKTVIVVAPGRSRKQDGGDDA
jgi:hypothetical protein